MRLQSHIPAYTYILAGLLGTICLFILFLFPSHNIKPIWKGYRVLVVPIEENEAKIVSLLAREGLKSLVTESNSQIRTTSEMAPVVPFLSDKNKMLEQWFKNADTAQRYIYIEETPFLETKINLAFTDVTFPWYFEKADGVHIVPVILLAVFFLVTLFFATDRFFLLAAGFPWVLYVLECNQYASFIAANLVLYVYFALENLLEPKQWILTANQRRARLKKYPWTLIPIIPAFFVIITSGVHESLMFVDTFCVSGSLAFLAVAVRNVYRDRLSRKRLHPLFKPNLMSPDTIGKKWPEKKILFFLVPLPVLFISGLFFFGNGKQQETVQELYIPSPTRYTRHTGFDTDGYTELTSLRKIPVYPDVAWFLAVRWNLVTAPWRRVLEPLSDPVTGSKIEIMVYSTDKNGTISGKKDTMNTFDLSFIRKTVSGTVTPLEKMLISQGRYVMVNLERHAK